MIAHFLHEAAASLAPGGVVHLTLTGQQPRLWAALPAARRAGLVLVQACEPTTPAAFLLEPTISVRAAEAGWAAARRYRTGVLGTRHWLSKYGYEHRRCDGDGALRLDLAVELTFSRPADAAAVASRLPAEELRRRGAADDRTRAADARHDGGGGGARGGERRRN